jgi:hypothetical protein
VGEKLHILKGPRNAQGGNPVGLETGYMTLVSVIEIWNLFGIWCLCFDFLP